MGDNIIRDVQFIDWLGEQRPFYGHKIMSIPSTPTPTPTATNTPTPSVTPTFTPTKSVTPTMTPTKSPTPTPSYTPTKTPTQTPTMTPTPSQYTSECQCFELRLNTDPTSLNGVYCQYQPDTFNGLGEASGGSPRTFTCGYPYPIWQKTDDENKWGIAYLGGFNSGMTFNVMTYPWTPECNTSEYYPGDITTITTGFKLHDGLYVPTASTGTYEIIYTNCP